ncbi:glycosyltransferase family 2 protein [Candidatus Fermentibacterales bacterium]|nr:glycosyltransferase family 2 protein [Candidatus Fermentibacterales bacterium]
MSASRTNALTLAVVNHNGGSVLPDMLSSVREEVISNGWKLILFDNGSSDGSDRAAEQAYSSEGWLRVLRSPVNLGYAAAVNRALEGVDTSCAIVANSDTAFPCGALEGLVRFLESRPSAGAVGPRLLWPDGRLQSSLRSFPFSPRLVLEHLPLLRRLTPKHSSHDEPRTVDWFVGAVIALRLEAFRSVGGFDEAFFFYHEETDLFYRMWKAGWEVWFTPAVEVTHVGGATAAAVYGRDGCYLRYIPAKLLFLRKHRGPLFRLCFRLAMTGLQVSRMLAGLLLPRMRRKDSRFSPGYCREAVSLLWSVAAPCEEKGD